MVRGSRLARMTDVSGAHRPERPRRQQARRQRSTSPDAGVAERKDGPVSGLPRRTIRPAMN